MSKAKKFTQSRIGAVTKNTKDQRGTVQIRVGMIREKGNIGRSFSVTNARVSEVLAAIKKALLK